MKQVVTERYSNPVGGKFSSCDISLSYDFEPRLEGTKERQEIIVSETNSHKTIMYWVRVANDPIGESYKIKRVYENKKEIQRKQRLKNLKEDRNSRILKYQKQIEEDLLSLGRDAKKTGEEVSFPDGIIPTEQDIHSASILQSMIGRTNDMPEFLKVIIKKALSQVERVTLEEEFLS